MPRTVVGTLAAVLALAAPAQAATTIGSNLNDSANGSECRQVLNPVACTLANGSLPAGSTADALTAPSAGVVVQWSVKSSSDFHAAPRVIAGTTGKAVGDAVTVANLPDPQRFPTRLPIAAGDAIGIDVTDPVALAEVTHTEPLSSAFGLERWIPPLGNGETRDPTSDAHAELLVNAVVEPDADGDGYGDDSQDGCPTDASTHDACPPPPPRQIVSSDGTTTTGSSGGTSSGPQPIPGSGGAVLVGGIPLTPPNVSAAPPLPTPKTAKKAKRCTRKRVHGKRVKRCKRKRSHRRR